MARVILRAWPSYDVAPAAYAHALGILSINYNSLEWIFRCMHEFYNGANRQLTDLVFAKIANNVRLDLLRKTAELVITDDDMREHIEHFADGFAVCTDNRNLLMHSQIILSSSDALTAVKRSRKDGAETGFEFRLSTLRRVADEIRRWYIFGEHTLHHGAHRRRLSEGKAPLPQFATLPEKFALPIDLTKLIHNTPPTPTNPLGPLRV